MWALRLDGMMVEPKDQKKVGLMVLMMDAQTYLEIHLAVMLANLTKKDAPMAGCLASLVMKGSWTVAYLAVKMGMTPNRPRRVAAGFVSKVEDTGPTVTFYDNVHGRVTS